MTSIIKKDAYYINLLRNQIEAQLGWGESIDWSGKSFEDLSERILEATGTQLSHTTLKRVWGRVRYTANPSDTTLDALAQFAGFENWLVFKQQQKVAVPSVPTSTLHNLLRVPLLLKIAVPVVWGLAVVAFFGLQSNKSFSAEELEQVTFSVTEVAEGLPNTVVFDYDIGDLPVERVFIQQKWDERKRIKVKPGQIQAALTYFYPGYYNAKLVLDGQIVRTHDLYIKSDGWLAAIEDEPMPQYVLASELLKDGSLKVDSSILQQANRDDVKTLSYFYFTDFHVPTQAFTLETAFRNTWRSGRSICQNSRVLIAGTEGCINLPFTIPGCAGEINLFLNGKNVYGDQTDLSGFGCTFDDFEQLKVQVKHNLLQVWLNEQLIYEDTFNANFGELVGVKYSFLGSGEVDYVRYSDAKRQVFFEDDF